LKILKPDWTDTITGTNQSLSLLCTGQIMESGAVKIFRYSG
jgi:hypothetical protein